MSRDIFLFHSAWDRAEAWRGPIERHLPDVDFRVHPDVEAPERVRFALVWNPPRGFFAPYARLQLVINLGAGVDSLLGRDDLPDVPITRVVDPDMSRMMASFVLFAVLRYARDIPALERAQRQARWAFAPPRQAREISVGVLGLGELGLTAAREIARWGFDVRGWSRTRKSVAGVTCYAGMDELEAFLRGTEIAIVMLPLTSQTHGLLDRARLRQLPRGAKFINVARGAIVDEPALIELLEEGHIAEATLDVFVEEPLPPDHPFWRMDNVLVTPHLASVAIPESAAAQIAANVARVRAGLEPLNRVDPARGY